MKKFVRLPALAATLGLAAATVSVLPADAAPQAGNPVTLEAVTTLVGPEMLKASDALETTHYQSAVLGAINPGEFVCGTTPFTNWLAGQLTGWSNEQKLYLAASILSNITSFAAMINVPARPSFGINGEYTKKLTSTLQGLKGFWDINGSAIKMVPMHSSIMGDRAALVKVYEQIGRRTPAEAAGFANTYATWYEGLVKQFGRNIPLISANAFAFSPKGDPNPALAALPYMIIMGDGVLQGFDWLQLGKVAPQAVLAHEYGHQVQYKRFLDESSLTTPEATRRIELMADAFSGYFLAHAKGANLNRKQLKLFAEMSYNIGDCGFDAPGHHGTPNQRLRSSEWGADLATDARNQKKIMPSWSFIGRFDAALPVLVAPDAPAVPAAA
ncbi:hypothetical protein [Kribbella sp. NPDC051770]|uniref:hypothetical protein n=1 Tax=Kribbella sp. NPDC051770 TaxID=3155413 RepID=UPI00342CF46A